MFGWRCDPHDPRDFHVRDMPGLTGGPLAPRYIDISAHAPPVRDQGATNTCVLQAATDALSIRASIEGRPIARPSIMQAYYNARRLESDVATDVIDRGCYPRLALQAMARWGVCSEERWPFSEMAVNDAPPWDCVQHALDARVQHYYRITGIDDERFNAIASALSAGFPVLFGTVVDEALMRGGFEPIGRAKGEILGRHAMLIVGRSDGAWLVRNSWGSGWSMGGYARLSDERVGGFDCDDFWVFDVVPRSVT